MSTKALGRVFAAGSTPDTHNLVGWELRGFNKPLLTRLGGFQKFKKGFFLKGDQVWGYNISVVQGPLESRWSCLPSDDSPKRFGFYSVRLAAPADKEPGAILLDYSDGDNRLWEGSFLRDYVKQVDPDNPSLYLGKAYSALGSAELMPTYFIIERDREAPREL